MVRYVLTFLLALCIASTRTNAQTSVLDSLQNALKMAREDTSKVRLLCRIAEEQQGEPAKARATAELTYTLARGLGDQRGAAEAMNRIAQTHNNQANFHDALRAAEQALALAKAAKNKREEAIAYQNMGTTQLRQGNFDAALDLFFQALPIQEELRNKKDMASTLNRIGLVYSESSNFIGAAEYYQKSLALATAIGDKRQQATPLNNIGNDYIDMKQYDTAIVYFRRAYTLNEQIQNIRGIAINRMNIGRSYLHLKQFGVARTELQSALLLWKELSVKNFLAYTLRVLSELTAAEGKVQEALHYGREALFLADSIGARPEKRDAMKALSEAYASASNTKEALKLYKDYIALRDSIVNDANTKRATYRENKYSADKKDKEILILKKDAENQALVRNSLVGGLSLVGVLVFVLILSNNRRKKANALLQEQAVQIQLANTELQQKNIVITEAHTETQRLLTNVNDSIRYAKRIQDAMLPSTETLNRLLPEHFIFFRPKDVVSGDFYWCREQDGKVFVAAVDCTGHGVPGAFMSLIGNALLNDIVQRLPDPHPDLVLNELHHELQTVLRQKETNNDDGMDICLCMIDPTTRIVEFAGAINPLYSVIQGELREFKGTPEELGGRDERSPVYTRHVLDVSEVPHGATMLYLASDGYKDQYNEVRQRFMPKRLRPLLTEIAAKPLEEQPRLLGATIDAHRGEVIQVDDMLILGVRL